MIENETQARYIGYGAMLMESFVAIMALVAACVIEPGIYYAMNSPAALIGTTPEEVARVVSRWGFVIQPQQLTDMAQAVGENTIISRTGGAPTLAVGMAYILQYMFGGQAMMAFWYHFAILFEALFILTAVDAGTRAGRFMLQDLLGNFVPKLRATDSLVANLIATLLCVAAWGYFLYQGVVDPLGGINTLWPLFGIANQMLAAVALVLGTVVLFRMKKDRYAWVTIVPTVWLLICTLTAGLQKIFHPDPKIGFLSHARIYSEGLATDIVMAPAKSLAQMQQIVINDYVNSVLCALFIFVVVSMVFFGIRAILQARRNPENTTAETPFEPLPEQALAGVK